MNDLTREKVVLNGVLFSNPRAFLPSLTRVAKVLTQDPSYSGTTCARDVVQSVMCKASRTTSGYDSYAAVTSLFVTEKYLLTPRTEDAPHPIHIELLLIEGSIQSSVSCINYYSLVEHPDRETAIENDSYQPRVWLKLETVVVEKTNYVTGRGARYLSIDLVHAEGEEDGDVNTTVHKKLQSHTNSGQQRSRCHRKSVCEILCINEMEGKEMNVELIENEGESVRARKT